MSEELENELLDLVSIESQIIELKNKLKDLEKRKASISTDVLNYFETVDTAPIETEDIKITYVKPRVQYSVDKEKLQEKYPEVVMEDVQKETTYKASIRITLKGEE